MGTTGLRCAACGESLHEDDRFCERCGARLTGGEVGGDRVELDLTLAAAVSDRGRVHTRNEDAFALAFGEVVRRHEGLRTRFAVVDGSPVQVIEPPGLFGLAVEDLSDRPEEERQAAARERAGVIAREPFDLERGPLFRAVLLKLSAE